jgi:HTH-type transcriptional regulator/antitoxin HigA
VTVIGWDLPSDFAQLYPDALPALLEERELKPSSLWPFVGSKARASEILSGKRAVSKLQAKRLADFFGVSAGLFL